MEAMRRETFTVEDRPARVWTGGNGEPLVLVHGGWGGASTHWSSVWDALAVRFRVIAPDLPGIGDTTQPGLPSLAAYGRWLADVLDAVHVPSAWLVGNSFGASVISRFALDYPERCRGLVFVNGFPMPESPRILRALGARPFGQRLLRAIEKRVAYTPSAVRRAFFDAANVPAEVRALVREEAPRALDALTGVLAQGGGPAGKLPVAPALVWGSEDRLPGTTARAARKLSASLRCSKVTFVPRAGHMPQVENPAVFVDAVTRAAQDVAPLSAL